jgi:hypothetical protein
MGVSTDAILFYGYDLGDPDDDGPAGDLRDAWGKAKLKTEDDDIDFPLAVAVTAGLVGDRPDYADDPNGWFAWDREADRAYLETYTDVDLVVYQSRTAPLWGLGVAIQSAFRGYVVHPTFDVSASAVERLDAVMDLLRLERPSEGPRWSLVSFWDQ